MAEQSAHVLRLAEEIGPRPATTDTEATAAAYIAGVFEGRGLEPSTQEFDAPSSTAFAFVLYHLLTIGAAVGSRWLPWWPMALLGLVVAFLMWRDLDTKWGLSSLMPKGPSQNVIARHVPKQRRNEQLKKVVLVAHYDSARADLMYSPSLVRNQKLFAALTRWATILVPLLIVAGALPVIPRDMLPIAWYVTLAVAAYLLLPLFTNLHRALVAKPVTGANDNAAGVAAMLAVMDGLVPEPDAAVFDTTSLPKQVAVTRRSEEEAREAEVVPEGAVLKYSPAEAPHRPPFEEGDIDETSFGWGEEPAEIGRAHV